MHNAVIVGPHMHNFTDAMHRALSADAITQVANAEELYQTVNLLLSDSAELKRRQDQALSWAEKENKVLDGIVEQVQGYLS